jgi:hypothetical protein
MAPEGSLHSFGPIATATREGKRIEGAVTMASQSARRWEYLAVPFKDGGDLKKNSEGLSPKRLNELGSQGWEAVGLSLKRGDLVAWPVVLLKRPLD